MPKFPSLRGMANALKRLSNAIFRPRANRKATSNVVEATTFTVNNPPNANLIKQSIAKALLIELTGEIPVDTSQLVSNWQVGLNNPPNGVLNAHVKGDKGSTREQSTSITRGIGDDVINSAEEGDDIFLANNAPYLKELGYLSQVQSIASSNTLATINIKF